MSHKTTITSTLVLGCLLLALHVSVFPCVIHNRASTAYSEPTTKQSQITDSIEDMIIAAAGHFLAGRASIQQLLVIIELKDIKGIDSTALDGVLGVALTNMQQARDLYQKIVTRATLTAYNKVTLSQLKSFGYEELRMNESLNRTIFAKVETFLKKGDVTGIFKMNVKQFNRMIRLLKQIKKDFAAGRVPKIVNFWQLNEMAAETAIFGSYTARVFAQIK